MWAICWQALAKMLPSGHGEEQVQFADMMLTANEAERRRCALCSLLLPSAGMPAWHQEHRPVWHVSRFFSSLLQRCGKANRRTGGGSVSLLAVVSGTPSLGHTQPKVAATPLARLCTVREHSHKLPLACRCPASRATRTCHQS